MSDWNDPRPLSPHLWGWRWHATMFASILHRMTGVANALGLALIVAWLMAVAGGAESYALWTAAFAHPIAQLILFGFTFGMVFHLINGVRYLFWDAGIGLSPGVANIVSIANTALAVLGAALIWFVAVFVL